MKTAYNGSLLEFERLWRQNFLEKMGPKYLPASWSLDFNSASRSHIDGNHEDESKSHIDSDIFTGSVDSEKPKDAKVNARYQSAGTRQQSSRNRESPIIKFLSHLDPIIIGIPSFIASRVLDHTARLGQEFPTNSWHNEISDFAKQPVLAKEEENLKKAEVKSVSMNLNSLDSIAGVWSSGAWTILRAVGDRASERQKRHPSDMADRHQMEAVVGCWTAGLSVITQHLFSMNVLTSKQPLATAPVRTPEYLPRVSSQISEEERITTPVQVNSSGSLDSMISLWSMGIWNLTRLLISKESAHLATTGEKKSVTSMSRHVWEYINQLDPLFCMWSFGSWTILRGLVDTISQSKEDNAHDSVTVRDSEFYQPKPLKTEMQEHHAASQYEENSPLEVTKMFLSLWTLGLSSWSSRMIQKQLLLSKSDNSGATENLLKPDDGEGSADKGTQDIRYAHISHLTNSSTFQISQHIFYNTCCLLNPWSFGLISIVSVLLERNHQTINDLASSKNQKIHSISENTVIYKSLTKDDASTSFIDIPRERFYDMFISIWTLGWWNVAKSKSGIFPVKAKETNTEVQREEEYSKTGSKQISDEGVVEATSRLQSKEESFDEQKIDQGVEVTTRLHTKEESLGSDSQPDEQEINEGFKEATTKLPTREEALGTDSQPDERRLDEGGKEATVGLQSTEGSLKPDSQPDQQRLDEGVEEVTTALRTHEGSLGLDSQPEKQRLDEEVEETTTGLRRRKVSLGTDSQPDKQRIDQKSETKSVQSEKHFSSLKSFFDSLALTKMCKTTTTLIGADLVRIWTFGILDLPSILTASSSSSMEEIVQCKNSDVIGKAQGKLLEDHINTKPVEDLLIDCKPDEFFLVIWSLGLWPVFCSVQRSLSHFVKDIIKGNTQLEQTQTSLSEKTVNQETKGKAESMQETDKVSGISSAENDEQTSKAFASSSNSSMENVSSHHSHKGSIEKYDDTKEIFPPENKSLTETSLIGLDDINVQEPLIDEIGLPSRFDSILAAWSFGVWTLLKVMKERTNLSINDVCLLSKKMAESQFEMVDGVHLLDHNAKSQSEGLSEVEVTDHMISGRPNEYFCALWSFGLWPMLYNVQHPLQQLFVKDTDTTTQKTPFSDTKGNNEGGKAIVSMDIEKDPSPPVSMASIESTSKETDSFNGLQDVPVSASEKLETQDTVEKHLNNESIEENEGDNSYVVTPPVSDKTSTDSSSKESESLNGSQDEPVSVSVRDIQHLVEPFSRTSGISDLIKETASCNPESLLEAWSFGLLTLFKVLQGQSKTTVNELQKIAEHSDASANLDTLQEAKIGVSKIETITSMTMCSYNTDQFLFIISLGLINFVELPSGMVKEMIIRMKNLLNTETILQKLMASYSEMKKGASVEKDSKKLDTSMVGADLDAPQNNSDLHISDTLKEVSPMVVSDDVKEDTPQEKSSIVSTDAEEETCAGKTVNVVSDGEEKVMSKEELSIIVSDDVKEETSEERKSSNVVSDDVKEGLKIEYLPIDSVEKVPENLQNNLDASKSEKMDSIFDSWANIWTFGLWSTLEELCGKLEQGSYINNLFLEVWTFGLWPLRGDLIKGEAISNIEVTAKDDSEKSSVSFLEEDEVSQTKEEILPEDSKKVVHFFLNLWSLGLISSINDVLENQQESRRVVEFLLNIWLLGTWPTSDVNDDEIGKMTDIKQEVPKPESVSLPQFTHTETGSESNVIEAHDALLGFMTMGIWVTIKALLSSSKVLKEISTNEFPASMHDISPYHALFNHWTVGLWALAAGIVSGSTATISSLETESIKASTLEEREEQHHPKKLMDEPKINRENNVSVEMHLLNVWTMGLYDLLHELCIKSVNSSRTIQSQSYLNLVCSIWSFGIWNLYQNLLQVPNTESNNVIAEQETHEVKNHVRSSLESLLSMWTLGLWIHCKSMVNQFNTKGYLPEKEPWLNTAILIDDHEITTTSQQEDEELEIDVEETLDDFNVSCSITPDSDSYVHIGSGPESPQSAMSGDFEFVERFDEDIAKNFTGKFDLAALQAVYDGAVEHAAETHGNIMDSEGDSDSFVHCDEEGNEVLRGEISENTRKEVEPSSQKATKQPVLKVISSPSVANIKRETSSSKTSSDNSLQLKLDPQVNKLPSSDDSLLKKGDQTKSETIVEFSESIKTKAEDVINRSKTDLSNTGVKDYVGGTSFITSGSGFESLETTTFGIDIRENFEAKDEQGEKMVDQKLHFSPTPVLHDAGTASAAVLAVKEVTDEADECAKFNKNTAQALTKSDFGVKTTNDTVAILIEKDISLKESDDTEIGSQKIDLGNTGVNNDADATPFMKSIAGFDSLETTTLGEDTRDIVQAGDGEQDEKMVDQKSLISLTPLSNEGVLSPEKLTDESYENTRSNISANQALIKSDGIIPGSGEKTTKDDAVATSIVIDVNESESKDGVSPGDSTFNSIDASRSGLVHIIEMVHLSESQEVDGKDKSSEKVLEKGLPKDLIPNQEILSASLCSTSDTTSVDHKNISTNSLSLEVRKHELVQDLDSQTTKEFKELEELQIPSITMIRNEDVIESNEILNNVSMAEIASKQTIYLPEEKYEETLLEPQTIFMKSGDLDNDDALVADKSTYLQDITKEVEILEETLPKGKSDAILVEQKDDHAMDLTLASYKTSTIECEQGIEVDIKKTEVKTVKQKLFLQKDVNDVEHCDKVNSSLSLNVTVPARGILADELSLPSTEEHAQISMRTGSSLIGVSTSNDYLHGAISTDNRGEDVEGERQDKAEKVNCKDQFEDDEDGEDDDIPTGHDDDDDDDEDVDDEEISKIMALAKKMDSKKSDSNDDWLSKLAKKISKDSGGESRNMEKPSRDVFGDKEWDVCHDLDENESMGQMTGSLGEFDMSSEAATSDTASSREGKVALGEFDIISHSSSTKSFTDQSSSKEASPAPEASGESVDTMPADVDEAMDKLEGLVTTPVLVRRMFTSSSQRLNESLAEVNVTLESPVLKKKLSASTTSLDSNSSTSTISKETIIPTVTISQDDADSHQGLSASSFSQEHFATRQEITQTSHSRVLYRGKSPSRSRFSESSGSSEDLRSEKSSTPKAIVTSTVSTLKRTAEQLPESTSITGTFTSGIGSLTETTDVQETEKSDSETSSTVDQEDVWVTETSEMVTSFVTETVRQTKVDEHGNEIVEETVRVLGADGLEVNPDIANSLMRSPSFVRKS